MKAIVEGVAKSTGCALELRCSHFCPPTDNDPAVVDEVAAAARELLGDGGVHWIELTSMGGEDFAFYQERVPGAFVRLGAAMADPRARRPLHSSTFDINEAALPVGAKLLVRAALRLAGEAPMKR
jgi:amidohydrolase